MKKLKLHTPEMTAENIEKLSVLFPACVTEATDDSGKFVKAIDFDQLRQELSDHIVDGPRERYHLTWPGKRKALVTANAPTAKTLRPCREQSVNFKSTQNVFIEGDNLEALKLLQEIYLGQVDLIYIDPPYNTGNDFVYNDEFSTSAAEFLERSNQMDQSGKRLVANPESNGRFHSDWLDMIYPRIRLARNLLSGRGVIVASIDENEVINLRKVFDEVFGESNFLFQITLLCNPKGRSQDKYVANCHEYLVGYSKHALPKGAINIPKDEEEIAANYQLMDKRGRYRELELRNTHREFGKHNRKNLYYPFYVSSKGEVSLEQQPGFEAVLPDWGDGYEGCWTWGVEKARAQLDEIVAKDIKGSWKIYRKNYAEGENGEASKQVKSIWTEKQFHTEKGQAAFNDLFETKDKIFQAPKSVDLIRQVLLMASEKDSIIMDFFAGSGTTAHAVLDQNASDAGARKFILVQMAEETPVHSEARKVGLATVADISKERVRRAGAKILAGKFHPNWNKDVGFRVLKVDASNMSDIYYSPDELKKDDLLAHVDNIREGRTAEDLLFQVLLDWGVDLSLPISNETIADKTVYFVDENALAACFDTGVSEELVKEVARRHPLRVVFRDIGFASDAVKINVEQIFKLLSPETDVKSI